MKKPKIILETDDSMSMTSHFAGTINDDLNIIEIKFETQNSLTTQIIRIYPNQIDYLLDFLTKSKQYLNQNL